MSSKVIPPGILIRPLPSCSSLMSTSSERDMPACKPSAAASAAVKGLIPKPDKLIGLTEPSALPSLTTSLRSSTCVIQALSSWTLESLKTLRRSACLVSSVLIEMSFGGAVNSVGNITAGFNERSLPSATPPSIISGPATWLAKCCRTGSLRRNCASGSATKFRSASKCTVTACHQLLASKLTA